jgi:NADP-dependent 3-hydroxy acid dehydrogenase YdfG
LVTGANQGIGLEVAKQLAARNIAVLVGSRSLARGEKAALTIAGDARALQLEVTDRASIAQNCRARRSSARRARTRRW